MRLSDKINALQSTARFAISTYNVELMRQCSSQLKDIERQSNEYADNHVSSLYEAARGLNKYTDGQINDHDAYVDVINRLRVIRQKCRKLEAITCAKIRHDSEAHMTHVASDANMSRSRLQDIVKHSDEWLLNDITNDK